MTWFEIGVLVIGGLIFLELSSIASAIRGVHNRLIDLHEQMKRQAEGE